jgi:pimeloyl-ACP methyl ester carboxylesterase
MGTFLVAHGAWTGEWFWRKMFRPMRQQGHELIVPTLTGLGERQHLSHKDIGLDTHIADVLNVLEYQDLAKVTLIGHSYGGMVATGVAHKAASRLDGLIYLDAFVPRSGECLLDLLPENASTRMREAARTEGDGWRVPPNPLPPDTGIEDVAWAVPRRVGQPLKTFEQPLDSGDLSERLAKTYIYCTRHARGTCSESSANEPNGSPGGTTSNSTRATTRRSRYRTN